MKSYNKTPKLFWNHFCAPRMGWKRYMRFALLKLARLSDTDEEIAKGLAHGAAVSWTPLPGLHIIIAALMSYLTKSSPLAAVFGTIIGNPWTLPFMWWLAYEVGHKIFSLLGFSVLTMPSILMGDSFFKEILNHPWALFLPCLCGGIILWIISWPIFYSLSYRLVKFSRSIKRKTIL
jgi:uncharacterized protein (DUF2062 family)